MPQINKHWLSAYFPIQITVPHYITLQFLPITQRKIEGKNLIVEGKIISPLFLFLFLFFLAKHVNLYAMWLDLLTAGAAGFSCILLQQQVSW